MLLLYLYIQTLHEQKISVFKITLTCFWSKGEFEEYVEAPAGKESSAGGEQADNDDDDADEMET
jgi:hypothetical protein